MVCWTYWVPAELVILISRMILPELPLGAPYMVPAIAWSTCTNIPVYSTNSETTDVFIQGIWPAWLSPVHIIVQRIVLMQMCCSPTATEDAPIEFWVSSWTGEVTIEVVWENIPTRDWPQHQTSPTRVTAQVCSSPAVIDDTPVHAVLEIKRGSSLPSNVPSPSWPCAFRPQHAGCEPLNTTHEWSPPAETDMTEKPVGKVAMVGLNLLFIVPSPSCPKELRPQQNNSPEEVVAHECAFPRSICVKEADSGMAV